MTFQINASDKINALSTYAFAQVDTLVQELKDQNITPIDFGVGDPLDPTPDFIIEALNKSAQKHSRSGYPSYIGSNEFRQSCADYMQKTFDVELDPDKEITSTIGSKEAVFHFPQAFLNPGDIVIVPSPGYPPMKTGTLFAGAVPFLVPLLEENNFLIDFESIPADIAQKAKIIWINYPNSPTGACASKKYYERLISWARKNEIIIAADEGCYIDIYYDKKPHSILEIATEGIIAFYSLSKRNNMTGYRVGFVAGDKRLVEIFKKLKTNIDSGTPDFVQDVASIALHDDQHAESMRNIYQQKKDILIQAFAGLGLEINEPDATFYIWQKTPKWISSVEFCQKLLHPDIAIVATPGAWISEECFNGINPGENYVRFALVPTLELCEEAAQRLKNIKLS